MATTIDSSYALNFGLAGLPVEAEFPTAALPDSRAIPPTGMPYVGEVDRLLAAGGTSALIRQWGHPKTVSPEVLSSSGLPMRSSRSGNGSMPGRAPRASAATRRRSIWRCAD